MNPPQVGAKPVANVVAFLVVAIINGLGASGVFFGNSQREISDKYATLITPAGFAFAIWGVIYFLQAAFVIWGVLPAQKANKILNDGVSWLFVAVCLFNSIWIIVFAAGTDAAAQASSFVISLVSVFLLLIYVRANNWLRVNDSWAEFILIDIHFSMYAGWVTVATIVNVAIAFVAGGSKDELWNVSATIWAIVVLAIALIINIAVVITRRDFIFPLVLAWATLAIGQNTPDGEVQVAAHTISILSLLLGLFTLAYRAFKFMKSRSSPAESTEKNSSENDKAAEKQETVEAEKEDVESGQKEEPKKTDVEDVQPEEKKNVESVQKA